MILIADSFWTNYCQRKLKKVLYLDGDVLNTGSLKELWSLDMGESSAAAVIDCLGEKYYELLGLGKNARYCNSGVILFDSR